MKAVFFDIDGTLIEGRDPKYRYMSEKVQKAIKKLQNQGHYVFIATGRPYSFLDEKIKNFGFDGYVLLNGAVIFFHDKIIYQTPLARDFVKNMCEICDKRKIDYILQSEYHTYAKPEFTYIIEGLANYGIHKEQLCFDQEADMTKIYKVELNSPRYEDKEYIINSLPDNITFTGETKDVFSESIRACHLEVFAKNISKATGALKVLELLNIDLKDSFAFGDGDNDIEILSTVGFGMAMENGTENAKKSAKVIVPSIFADGVAYGIEKYILKQDNE